MKSDSQAWKEQRIYNSEKYDLARKILEDMRAGHRLTEALRRHPLPEGGYAAKHLLIATYRHLVETGEFPADTDLLRKIRMKPVRTLSGVTTISVLTKPYPCVGECLFCPTDIRLPKSYLPDEPGARRALEHRFDPYDQVIARLQALEAVGHPTDKIELLVLGGTWSVYPRRYQEWFIHRCFEALNGSNSASLKIAHDENETTNHRNVGLVVETRPDLISLDELIWYRKLGVTKVQLGAQSLDNQILIRNRRGHSAQDTLQAVSLLRATGFKTVLHWMPNLLGATLESDRQDFQRLWNNFCPDEIKIYPTQLLENTQLYQYWLKGEYRPYTTQELIDLIADIKTLIPRYSRVNRVVRDIPSTYVVAGNRRTSLRQDIHREMQRRGTVCQCIRCREVSNQQVNPNTLRMSDLTYTATETEEHFLALDTPEDKLAGFLRLSLPTPRAISTGIGDLQGAALIRELHIYGQSLPIGAEEDGAAQHVGLGKRLVGAAEKIALERGFRRLAVISAVGTRHYYLRLGFDRGELYLIKKLT